MPEQLRGICIIDLKDEEFKGIKKNARRKSKKTDASCDAL